MFVKADAVELFISFLAPVYLLDMLSMYTVSSEKQSRAYEKIRNGERAVAIAPPRWVFPVVWLTLDTLAAVAAYIVRKQPWVDGELRYNAVYEPGVNLWPLVLFWIFRVLLFLYTWVFFGANASTVPFSRRLLGTFVVFICLVMGIIVGVEFTHLSTWAGVLIFLTVAWLLFALLLSFSILRQGTVQAAGDFVNRITVKVENGTQVKTKRKLMQN
jgi:tryptophan-rich sensory protein